MTAGVYRVVIGQPCVSDGLFELLLLARCGSKLVCLWCQLEVELLDLLTHTWLSFQSIYSFRCFAKALSIATYPDLPPFPFLTQINFSDLFNCRSPILRFAISETLSPEKKPGLPASSALPRQNGLSEKYQLQPSLPQPLPGGYLLLWKGIYPGLFARPFSCNHLQFNIHGIAYISQLLQRNQIQKILVCLMCIY